MSFEPGTVLGHYEIAELIGKGGMGEVYRARDKKLARDVAIKVLPDAFSRDQERLDRFEREARLLAQLNHANVATLHGLEESDGQRFLVMELVEGETLAERIASGAIPIDDALPLFVQIADGLEAAHGKGIIHRDLKPANIKIGPDGKIKILDFGLAKGFSNEGDVSAEASQSPTLTKGTALGAIMGTAAYMSPEQAKGKSVDARSDIWAFGCVMFEALSSQKAFRGEDVSETLAAVLRDEPKWKALPRNARLETTLRRCFQKDARRRFHHVGDVRLELEDVRDGAEPPSHPSGSRFWWGLAAGAAVALVTALVVLSAVSSPIRRPTGTKRFVVDTDPMTPMGESLFGPSLAISPDGSAIAIAGTRRRLYIRSMNQLATVAVDDTEGATQPFFSPDGEWIGFYDGVRLRKVPRRGGASVTIAEVGPLVRGATWAPDDTIVFGRFGGGLMRVSANGGTPTTLTEPDTAAGEFNHCWPHFLPDGRTMLFAAGNDELWHQARIASLNLVTGEERTVHVGGTYPRYLESGHLVYAVTDALMALPFDPARGATTGQALTVVGDVAAFMSNGFAHAAVNHAGSLAYIAGRRVDSRQASLVWVNRDGVEAAFERKGVQPFAEPRLSPNGERIAVTITDNNREIWIFDLARGGQMRLTANPGEDESHTWTPDGRSITYASTTGGRRVTLQRPADGSSEPVEVSAGDYRHQHLGEWTSDGRILAITEATPALAGDSGDLWFWQPESNQATNPFASTRFTDRAVTFSPDGQWFAYASDDSGPQEVYVRQVSGEGGKWQVSTAGGTEPYWSRGGDEIFFRSENRMMRATIDTRPDIVIGRPVVLFEGQFKRLPWGRRNYDVTSDGQRFLMVKPVGDTPDLPTEFVVVLDWSSELERLVRPSN